MFGRSRKSLARPAQAPIPPPEASLTERASIAVADAAPAAAPARKTSTLAADLQFDGAITGGGDLQIDGLVRGDVRVARLIIGETGAIEGDVSADLVEVHGRIVGAVSGREVRLLATAYVEGDVTSEQLAIDLGAYFQGRVLKTRRDPVKTAPVVVAPTPPTTTQATITPAFE